MATLKPNMCIIKTFPTRRVVQWLPFRSEICAAPERQNNVQGLWTSFTGVGRTAEILDVIKILGGSFPGAESLATAAMVFASSQKPFQIEFTLHRQGPMVLLLTKGVIDRWGFKMNRLTRANAPLAHVFLEELTILAS